MLKYDLILRDYSKLELIKKQLEKLGVENIQTSSYSKELTHVKFNFPTKVDLTELLNTGFVSAFWVFDGSDKIIDFGKAEQEIKVELM